MSENKIHFSLGVKLFILITILILFTAFAVTGFVITQKQKDNLGTLIDKGKLTSRFLAELSEFGVFSENEEALQQLLEKLNDPEIAYAAILRNDGSVLADRLYGETEIPDTLPPPTHEAGDHDRVMTSLILLHDIEHLQFVAPVLSTSAVEFDWSAIEEEEPADDTIRLGYVRLVYSEDTIKAATRKAVLVVILVTLAIVVVSLLLTLVLVRRILHPINRLVEGTRSIASGDLDTYIKTTTGDELGVLALSFNDMVDQLRSSREELDQYHRTLEKEVTDRTAELLKEKERAEKASRAKSDFLGMVSHEIRTPLNAVVGMTDVLLTTKLSEIQKHYTGTIHSSGEILLSLIDNILIFSKLDAGKLVLEKRPFHIRELAENASHILAGQAFKKDLEFYCIIPVDLTDGFRGDPDRLMQVLVNLLSNAIKFTEYGRVELVVAVEGENADSTTIRFEVRDTGIGIDPQKQEEIFNAFVQADGTTTRKFGGSGLGLSISKGLVNLMGGRISLESSPGEGARFWFSISLQKHEQEGPLPGERLSLLRDKKVLIVDAHPLSRDLIAVQLDYWRIPYDFAENGSDALEALIRASRNGEPYHAALLDCHLPDMDSLELAHEVRRHKNISPVSLMVMGALVDEVSPQVMEDHDLDHYLLKPVRQKKLHEALVLLCRERNLPPSRVVEENSFADDRKAEDSVSRILLVEDNQTNREVAVSMLEILGYEVIAVENGQEAVEAITGGTQVELIFMDCQMPVMDGFESTRKIREFEGTAKTDTRLPIIALTGNVQEGVEEECLSAGMDDYLSKPFDMNRLQAKLSDWLK